MSKLSYHELSNMTNQELISYEASRDSTALEEVLSERLERAVESIVDLQNEIRDIEVGRDYPEF